MRMAPLPSQSPKLCMRRNRLLEERSPLGYSGLFTCPEGTVRMSYSPKMIGCDQASFPRSIGPRTRVPPPCTMCFVRIRLLSNEVRSVRILSNCCASSRLSLNRSKIDLARITTHDTQVCTYLLAWAKHIQENFNESYSCTPLERAMTKRKYQTFISCLPGT